MRWWDRRCQHHSLIKLYNNQMQKASAVAECKGDAAFPASDLERSKDQIGHTAYFGHQFYL